MGTQPKLPGTLPAPATARKNHAEAVKREREALRAVENLRDAMREARKAVKLAAAERARTEDDLDAIDAGRRP